ncbi:hypothetical protein [Paracoccus albus]|uniref:hypothetical protein n=1 Tax=Paracoccus albus TaxID=3017784 RepID=UPI0022F14063|nr:hypothetical protein [Paracoccus albus]WBU61127.1 hypothetical protein PAF20_04230 [Paracoccus albus]
MRKSTLVLAILLIVEAAIIAFAGFALCQVRSGIWADVGQLSDMTRRIVSLAAIAVGVVGATLVSVYASLRAAGK